MKAIFPIAIFYFAIVFGFSAAFKIIYPPGKIEWFKDMFDLYLSSLGQQENIKDFYQDQNADLWRESLFDGLLGVYYLFTIILLLNFLIALMVCVKTVRHK